MTLKAWMLSWGAALAALTQTGLSQPASPWRAFKFLDGLPEPACVSVTLGPQGTVLARHLRAPSLTRLDGYDVSVIPAPRTSGGRVYESPAGQLWAAAPNGLYEFRDGGWLLHQVEAIAAETLSPATRSPNEFPLCPVRQGRVLFLLRDGLMALNADHPEHVGTEVLRQASATRIGPFLGLTVAPDGGLWISGARGLAKLPAPARSLTSDSEWQEFPLPLSADGSNEWSQVENLCEPRADTLGGVTAIGESAKDRRQVIVHFDGQRWALWPAVAERLRFAWTGPGPTRWAITTNALFCQRPGQDELVRDDEFSARQLFDVATEAGGAFWIATFDGLYRHAPPVWNTPALLHGSRGPVQAIVEDSEGRLWFAAGSEMHSLQGERYHVVPTTEALRNLFQTTRAILPLANGTLLFDAGDRLLQVAPANGNFEMINLNGRPGVARIVGTLGSGVACVQRSDTTTAADELRLETYDGTHFEPFPKPAPAPQVGRTLHACFQARNGDVWLSGDNGVARVREGACTTFPAADQTAPEAAFLFAETTDGKVWAATSDKLWAFDGRSWALIRAGFDRINGLTRTRDESLWVASDGGLHRLTSSGWIENGMEEGLPSMAVRCLLEDRRGRLWAGTSQGVSLQSPEADPDPPKTEILPPNDLRILEGGWVAVGFAARDKWKSTPRNRLLYSHRLDARDWSAFLEGNSVTLSDLAAGKHLFQVRAMDRNGNIEAKPAQFAFTVELPWFKETRLMMIAAFGASGALFFAALAFNRHLRLRRSYAEVERKVAERTRELEMAGRELLHSQKMNALGTLAAGIAHDFNNILSIVKGSAQIIEDNLDNPQKVRTRVDRIKTVVEQGAGIVQAMLGFSRSSEESPGPCDLNGVVDNTLTLLGDRFLREIEVQFNRAADLPPVPAPKDFIQQILLNFIFNAAESMTDRRLIVVATRRMDRAPADLVLKPAAAAGYVAVSVQDFGCGIPPENLSRIFEPFFTTKALSTRRGTGLGLSMVYQLAGRMKAGLAVESAVGGGSTFTLILPAP